MFNAFSNGFLILLQHAEPDTQHTHTQFNTLPCERMDASKYDIFEVEPTEV